jgi:hypothetical protein
LPYLWDTKNIKAKRNTQSADPLSSSASIVREQEVCGLRWDWEIAVPELDTTVFVLPDSETKTRTERVIVLNSIAKRIVDARRASADASGYVFSYRGKRLGTLRTSAWRRAWTRAGLPEDLAGHEGGAQPPSYLRTPPASRWRGAGDA